MTAVRWRMISDWAKRKPLTLRVADWLGRGRGNFRYFDRLRRSDPAPHKPDLSNWHKHELAAVWIGHATVLLRIGGLTILTDPVLFSGIGLELGLVTAGPRRLVAPAMGLRQLPPLDLILVSHAHFDHLDRPTLNRLPKHVPVITTEHNSDLIRDLRFSSVTEMRVGESMQFRSLKLTARKVRHWGARTFHDEYRGYAAFLLEAGNRRIFFGADTGHCDYFRDLSRVDLAIFGIGGYNPYIQAHANPEQALDMANQMHAECILPMHHSTFRLSHEPVDEPIGRMLDAAGNHGRVALSEVGGMWVR